MISQGSQTLQQLRQQVDTLKQLQSMMTSGAAAMATRMLPQVLEMLGGSNAAGLVEEKATLA